MNQDPLRVQSRRIDSVHSGEEPAGHPQSYYRNLARHFSLQMVLVSLVPLLVICAIIGYEYHSLSKARIIRDMEQTVSLNAKEIDIFLAERLANIEMIGKTARLENLRDKEFLATRLRQLQEAYGPFFFDLSLVQASGRLEAYAGPLQLPEHTDYSSAAWFKEASGNPTSISDVFSGLRGEPHFIVTARIGEGRDMRILRATIDFAAFSSLVEGIAAGETGTAFITNLKGEFQTRPRISVNPGTTCHERLLQSPDRTTFICKERDGSGQLLFVTARLKKGEWLLVYRQLASDAFGEPATVLLVTAAVLIAGVTVILVLSRLVSAILVEKIKASDLAADRLRAQFIQASKLASLGELAAGIAHEINNPVGIMAQEAGWISDIVEDENALADPGNVQEIRKAAAQIRTQERRCKDITMQLLRFARRTDPAMEESDLNGLVEEMATLARQRAKMEGAEIKVLLAPDMPKMLTSVSEMQQVLLNLINNSLDALPKKAGKVEVATKVQDNQVLIEVSDNGGGIPEENLGRIFDPFFTTKPVGKGTGLGLSIVYGIVQRLGGKIDVESRRGEGTTFRIAFPYTQHDVQALPDRAK